MRALREWNILQLCTATWYYSPDCTPIEQAFSKIKTLLRGLGARTRDALQEAVRLAIAAITREDTAAWFTHAGYILPDQGK